MNCAYQYSHNGHPQNVMTITPTAPQQGLHPVQEAEYLEVRCRDLFKETYMFIKETVIKLYSLKAKAK